MSNLLDKIEIYADGPTNKEIEGLDKNIVKGLTFNPTLFKNLGVIDYMQYCETLTKKFKDYPLSLEVISDSIEEMTAQGIKLGQLSNNVYVKIPITFTNSISTIEVIKNLAAEDIKLNITAIFTKKQVEDIIPSISESGSIISIFSGRLFDIGMDAVSITKDISKVVHENSNCKVLWASPRMVYDIYNAINSNCDIITMQYSLIQKIKLFSKTPEEYSLDTVKMFYDDAVSSKYSI